MKKLFYILLLSLILSGCSSMKLISSSPIPEDKETIFLIFDNTQATISAGSYVVGNTVITGIDTGTFNTLNNRLLAKTILTEKGYKVTQNKDNADMYLYAGCEMSEIQSVVTLMLVDAKTEEDYVISKGSFGMGLDVNGDIKGALKNALQNIPAK